MAITSTWSVTDMQRKDSDGGVFLVYWNCTAASDGDTVYTAVEAGKLRCEPDPTSPDYIPYDNLTVQHVQLNGTTAVALRYKKIAGEAVLPSTLGATPTTPYIKDTDYVIDYDAGTIARDAGGSIGDGDVVKVTYRSSGQILLTHMQNFIVGIGRDIRIERDRNIYRGVNEFAITLKVAVQFEEASAVVKAFNITM